MRKLLTTTLIIGLISLGTANAQNLLTNGDFENGLTGFNDFWQGAAASTDVAQSGTQSLLLPSQGAWSVPGALQTVPVTAGIAYNFQGYLRTEVALGADSSALFKIIWSDGTNEIQPLTTDPFLIGNALTGANPGNESTPFLTSTSAAGAWTFSEAQGTAPVGAVQANFMVLFLDGSQGNVYADDLSVTVVPEPSTFALLGGLLALGYVIYRRRK